jgi:hypothetical protein
VLAYGPAVSLAGHVSKPHSLLTLYLPVYDGIWACSILLALLTLYLPVCVGMGLQYLVGSLPGHVGMVPGLTLVYGGLGLCQPVPHRGRHPPSRVKEKTND